MGGEPSTRVLAEAVRLAGGDASKARNWYFNTPVRELDFRTAARAVEDGDEDKVVQLLEIYDLGFLG